MSIRRALAVVTVVGLSVCGAFSPPAAQAQMSPSGRALPPTLLPDEALPASLDAELRVALVRVRAAIDEDAGTSRVLPRAQADRLRCQLMKLADPKTDDRQISWMGACGVLVNALSATQCSDSIAARIKAQVKTKSDLDKGELWFLHHMRPEIINASRRLFGGDSVRNVARMLRDYDSDKFYAVHGLRRMGERTQGFLGVPHYLAINDWVAKEQRDSSSVNSCR